MTAGGQNTISRWGISPRGGLHPVRVFSPNLTLILLLLFVLLLVGPLCWSRIICFTNSSPSFQPWLRAWIAAFASKCRWELSCSFLDGSHRNIPLRSTGFEALYISSRCSAVSSEPQLLLPPLHNGKSIQKRDLRPSSGNLRRVVASLPLGCRE